MTDDELRTEVQKYKRVMEVIAKHKERGLAGAKYYDEKTGLFCAIGALAEEEAKDMAKMECKNFRLLRIPPDAPIRRALATYGFEPVMLRALQRVNDGDDLDPQPIDPGTPASRWNRVMDYLASLCGNYEAELRTREIKRSFNCG